MSKKHFPILEAAREAYRNEMLYFKNESRTLLVKVDPIKRMITRLKTGPYNVKDPIRAAWRITCESIHDIEQWQIDEIKSTLIQATDLDYNARKVLFLQQIQEV